MATATVDSSGIKEKNTSGVEEKIAGEEEGKISGGEGEENWLNQVIHSD
jgi:hypothetical protein